MGWFRPTIVALTLSCSACGPDGTGPDADGTVDSAASDDTGTAVSDTSTPVGPCLRVFLSSQRFRGNFGGARGGDGLCENLAINAGVDGTWMAWMSDEDGGSPASRFTQSTVPYRRMDLALVANDWADLTDGSIAAPITVYENGNGLTEFDADVDLVWTSTAVTGEGVTPGGCNHWTSFAVELDGAVVSANNTDARWTEGTDVRPCDRGRRIYCFEQGEPSECM